MALEPIELAQLWVATLSGLAGLAALFWQAYERLRQPRLRFERRWLKFRSWSRVDGQSRTLYGVFIQYTGQKRAGSVSVDCELPGWKWRGQFAEKGHVSTADVESKELIWVFTVDEEDTLSFEHADPRPTGSEIEPPTLGEIRPQRLRLLLRSNNVEGADARIKVATLIRRAQNLPP